MNAPLPTEAQDALYLGRLGERVRAWRNAQAMTRKQLAEASGVSERYLAQLEAGAGQHLGAAAAPAWRAPCACRSSELVREDTAPRSRAHRPPRPARRRQVHARREARRRRSSCRSSSSTARWKRRPAPSSAEVFAHVRPGRVPPLRAPRARARARRERARGDRRPAAAWSPIPATYELLLERCFCVWLKASPEEHMSRVIAQGDMRPFQDERRARSAALDEIREPARRPRAALRARRRSRSTPAARL